MVSEPKSSLKPISGTALSAGTRLVIIDGANFLYRAFFALPPLRNAAGLPTNALLGVANMLNKVLREEKPDAIVVVFDVPGKSFRHGLYPQYKAHREAMPEDLAAQIPAIRELIAAHRIPILEVSGVEADDVIATLAHHAACGVRRVIVSTDKDLMQLVGDDVELLDTMKSQRTDVSGVESRFGVSPKQMLDFRALVGDPSDNIPGVKGIGEKGAAQLIQEWGDLETLLANAEQVKSKRAREGLIAQADAARLSKSLSELRQNVSLPISWDALLRHESDKAKLAELYRRFEFSRLLKDLDLDAAESAQVVAPRAAVAVELQIQVIADLGALQQLVKKLRKLETLALLAVAAENGSAQSECAGVVFALSETAAAYVALRHQEAQGSLALGEARPALTPEILARELQVLFDPKRSNPSLCRWIGSDVKLTQSLLRQAGLELPPACFDVDLAAYLLDSEGRHSTPALATQYLGRTLRTWEDVAGKGAKAKTAVELPSEVVAQWAGEEICAIAALMPCLRQRLDAEGLAELFDRVEMPLTAVLGEMECAGVRIDETLLQELSQQYSVSLANIEREIFALAGEEFLVSSPKQLQRILFEKLKLPIVKKIKTGYSTDEDVLEQLAAKHELPSRVLAYRHLAKLKGTYVDALPRLVNPRTGRIHPHLHQTGTATGRLSCSDPNLQNIPIRTDEGQRIREAFIPAEGQVLLSADYSQIELRILAHFSEDEALLRAFTNAEDIHRSTAAEVLGISLAQVSPEQRSQAKAVNFGIIYGSSAFGLANQLGIATDAAKEYIDAYFARYPGVRRFIDSTIETARAQGMVRTLLGRRRYLPDLKSRNRVLRQAAERMAVNTVIQGSAADLIKKAMVDIARALCEAQSKSRMILQVHDELILESPKSELGEVSKLLRDKMEMVWPLKVRLLVEVGHGRNWREAH